VQKTLQITFPFSAIIGMQAAKRALMLLAVETQLKGVLLAAAPGSAKSLLVRALPSILPEPLLNSAGEADGPTLSAPPFVELPLSVTEDRLLGGIDLERTIATGARQLMPGLLAQADGGLLYADDVNLLDAGIAVQIGVALETESLRVEREGLSVTCPTRLFFIGTYNPTEGEVSASLKDRVGLSVEGTPADSVEDAMEIIRRALRFNQNPRAFVEEYAIETAELRIAITDARARLSEVRASRNTVRRIADAAMRLGVEGNRADWFAVRAACASAALAGRNQVNDEDMITAIQLVLMPRATVIPERQQSQAPADSSALERDQEPREPEDSQQSSDNAPRAMEDLLIAAMDALPPDDALMLTNLKTRRATAGKRDVTASDTRGRYAGASAQRPGNGKLALDATLRAAAPLQSLRRAQRIDCRVEIRSSDLRYKRLKRRSGMLFIFAVDASGSMALNRMAQAKGALTRLLQQAYLHRDSVALISFRRQEAEVLLAPTRSVELARQLVDALPTGGATPMAAAIIKAIDVARRARLRGTSQAMLVLLTDGRSNVGLYDAAADDRTARVAVLQDELRRLGARLQADAITAVVIDTKSRFVSSGEGRALAETLGGRYLYLPRADEASIHRAVTALAEDARRFRLARIYL
jgi:magnesium chelatase subunit D